MMSHHCSTVPTLTAPEAAPATVTSDLLIVHPGRHISAIRTLLHLKWWTLPSGLKNYVMVNPVLPFFSHWCLVFHLLSKCWHFVPCKLDPLSPHADISTKLSSPISRLGRVSYNGNSKSVFQPGFYWVSNLHSDRVTCDSTWSHPHRSHVPHLSFISLGAQWVTS